MTIDNNRTNQQLIQLKECLNYSNKDELEKLIGRIDDINIQVAPTNYLTLRYPHWIGNTILHFAFTVSQFDLSDLLIRGADYTIKNQNELTVLHLTLRYRNSDTFRFANLRSVFDILYVNTILSAHVNMNNPTNPSDGNGMSHFHIACMANHTKAIELFLDNDVPINHAINPDSPYFAGFTGLHLAIRCCNFAATKVLLKREASIYLKNNENMTAVHMVFENNLKLANDFFLGYFGDSDLPKKHANEEIAKLLLDIISNSGTRIIDDSGLSSLHLACTMMHTSIAEKLLVEEDINQPINNKSALWPGYTALHFAAFTNCKTVGLFVKKGADLLAKNVNGITPLDILVERYSTEEICNILSLNSVCKEITCTQGNIKLLDLVSATKDFDQFEAFLNSFSEAAIVSVPMSSSLWPGFTLMHLIVLFSKSFGNGYYCDGKVDAFVINDKYFQMIRELLDRNGNVVTIQDLRGRTPIHLSFQLDKMIKIEDLLLTLLLDCPFDCADDEDLSLLHIACIKNNKDLVDKLLTCSKNVNLAYKGKLINSSIGYSIKTGWTPLHVAVDRDSVNIVKMLLNYGADVHSKDVNGVTPIHLLVSHASYFYYDGKYSTSAESLLSVQNLKECIVEDTGLSHLHVAFLVNNEDAVKKLIGSSTNIDLSLKIISKLVNFRSWMHRKYNFENLERLKTFDLMIKYGVDILVEDFDSMPFAFEYLEYFVENFKKNDKFKRRVEAKFGFTEVHLACLLTDLDWLKILLKNGANVNGKLSMNLSKYSGLTPLLIIMESSFPYPDEARQYEFVTLLLDNGADVTVASNKKQRTPIHTAYRDYFFYGSYIPQRFSCIIAMLKAQKDFSINPTSAKGISHFHIACFVNEISVVKKFLERGNIDVNRPIDFFTARMKPCTPGYTPLHMAAYTGVYDRRFKDGAKMTSQLETVDLLLKHGADPNFQNSYGKSPLRCVGSLEIFERMARDAVHAANVDIIKMLSDDTLFRALKDPIDRLQHLLRCGCRYNAFNTFTDEGYIGQSIELIPFEKLQDLLKIVAINMPDAMRVDEKSHTVIHNIVSVEHADILVDEYATLIDILAKTGYDIDSQDNLGKTALHLATKFENAKAISALLMLGADVNIQDKNGKTALACHIGCTKFDEGSERCDVLNILTIHLKKLQYCRIDVCQSDRVYVAEECNSMIVNAQFYGELEELKNMKIGFTSLTLYNFISETDAVADYPTISEFKRDVIDDYFQQNACYLRKKFSEVKGLLNLQYRKAAVRSQFIKNAPSSLSFLANFQIPELSSHIILRFLSNSDLKNLIAST